MYQNGVTITIDEVWIAILIEILARESHRTLEEIVTLEEQ